MRAATVRLFTLRDIRVQILRYREIPDGLAYKITKELGSELREKMIKITYKVIVEKSGKFWVISVPAIRGLYTQALSENTIEFMTRDAISMMLEVEPMSFDLEFEFMVVEQEGTLGGD